MAELHTCGCSTFGPEPHPIDARHPNPKACMHSEDTAKLWEAAAALVDEVDAYIAGDRPLDGHYLRQALERLRAVLPHEDGAS